jgi:hypothetical protein
LTWCTKNPLPERYTNILWWFNDFFFKRFLLKKSPKNSFFKHLFSLITFLVQFYHAKFIFVNSM